MTELTKWATDTGDATIKTGLNIESILWSSGGTIDIDLAGEDLTGVNAGHYLVVTGAANDLNNGTFLITGTNVVAETLQILNTTRARDTTADNEASTSATANVVSGAAVSVAIPESKQGRGFFHGEEPSAEHFNWLIQQMILLVFAAVEVLTNITTWAAQTRTASRASLVRGLGWVYFELGNTEQAGDGVYKDDDDSGRGFIELAHPDATNAALAAFVPEILPPVKKSLTFSSDVATVTVEGAQVGDAVSIGPHATFAGQATGRVSAVDTVTIQTSGGSPDGIWSVTVTRPNSMPVISERGRKIYVNLIGGAYTSATLETDLEIDENEAAFRKLVNSQQHRATIRLDADIKAVVELSDIADGIMTETGGY